MPREIVTRVTVYKYGELSKAAQAKAVESAREKLSGPWWDSTDNEEISETIAYAFAQQLGTPGHATYGEADFPGIPGINLAGWDLERGESVEFKGKLTRENAPALPWVDGIVAVHLNDSPHFGFRESAHVVWDDVEPYEDAQKAADSDMGQAARDAMRAAWEAGRTQMDYKCGDEYAREWIEGNEPAFTEDGALHSATY